MKPDIYIFNSTCELAVANGVFSYMPPKRFREMEAALATLPSFFARESDIVITPGKVDKTWVDNMKACGFTMPQFLTKNEINNLEIDFLRPWGWSPAQHFYFKGIKQNCSKAFNSTVNSEWNDSSRDLYSRITSRDVLSSIISSNPLEIFPKIEELPRVCNSIDEVKQCVDSSERILLKSPWSSSGRGLYLLEPNILGEVNCQWVSGVLKNQKYVMAELWKTKVCDFSFQYFIDEQSDIESVGVTSFRTDKQGNYIGSNFSFHSVYENNARLKAFLTEDVISNLDSIIKSAINQSRIPTEYYGYLGVDCMVYEDDGQYKIQPCVEINLRYNMGVLSLKIKEQLHDNVKGFVSTDYVDNSPAFISEMQEKYPVEIVDNVLDKGFVPISIPNGTRSFITYILVE